MFRPVNPDTPGPPKDVTPDRLFPAKLGGFTLSAQDAKAALPEPGPARREVLQKVPMLEKGEEAAFDERKFGARVRQAGFALACCRDLFVHHFGSHLVEPGAGQGQS